MTWGDPWMEAPLLPALPGYDNPQLIAHGTTALVFRAVQTNLNRPVAIKVITADTGSVPINAARELATTVALSSQPHIVSIIDTGVTEDDRPYIVMEYCEGGSYAQILRHGGPLAVDDVLDVGIKIGEALHAAHKAGIVHRDVKPSNLLRSRFGPALTDFGIARAPDELGGTLTREMMTPHHASPEALLHQAQSGISDVYSLASTMWTLLVGHPPFVDATKPALDMYAFRDRVLHEQLPAMPREDVPAWLVGELTRAMSKLPSQRHASALEFAEALRRGALGLALPTAPHSVPAQARGRVHVPGVPVEAHPAPEPRPLPASPPLPAPAPVPSPSPMPTSSPVPAPPLAPTSPPVWPPPSPASAAAPAPDSAPVPHSAPEPHSAPVPHSALDSDSAPTPVPALAMADEGGWLGPATDAAEASWPAEPDPTPEAPFPTRRFDGRDLMPTGSGQRNGLVLVLIAVAVLAVAGASALLLTAGDRQTAAAPSATGTPTRFITAQAAGAPRDVRVANDRGTAVTIAWTDPTSATVSFLVVGTGPAGEKLAPKSVSRGTTTVTYAGLSSLRNYCFVVSAVYAVDQVATATEVCTRR